jgi:hypothetical protein
LKGRRPDLVNDGVLDLVMSTSDYQNAGAHGSLAVMIATGPKTYSAPVVYGVGVPAPWNRRAVVMR